MQGIETNLSVLGNEVKSKEWQYIIDNCFKNQKGGPCLGMIDAWLIDVVITLDNPEGFQKALLCMTPKFVRYVKYTGWDM